MFSQYSHLPDHLWVEDARPRLHIWAQPRGKSAGPFAFQLISALFSGTRVASDAAKLHSILSDLAK
jgi:hypothetical protein